MDVSSATRIMAAARRLRTVAMRHSRMARPVVEAACAASPRQVSCRPHAIDLHVSIHRPSRCARDLAKACSDARSESCVHPWRATPCLTKQRSARCHRSVRAANANFNSPMSRSSRAWTAHHCTARRRAICGAASETTRNARRARPPSAAHCRHPPSIPRARWSMASSSRTQCSPDCFMRKRHEHHAGASLRDRNPCMEVTASPICVCKASARSWQPEHSRSHSQRRRADWAAATSRPTVTRRALWHSEYRRAAARPRRWRISCVAASALARAR
jgi:hypothetical protein